MNDMSPPPEAAAKPKSESGRAKPGLFKALVAFQALVPTIYRDLTVDVTGRKGSYSFEYATYENMVATVRPLLAAQGLGFSNRLEIASTGMLLLVTRVFHSSGEFEDSRIPLICDFSSSQSLGSANSYSKRYGLSNALGLATDDDDDGNIAEGNDHVVTAPEDPMRQLAEKLRASIKACRSMADLDAIPNYTADFARLAQASPAAAEFISRTFAERQNSITNGG